MEEDDFGKAKNIRQTEILVDLREAILKIARHFQSLDPKNNKVVTIIVEKFFFWNSLCICKQKYEQVFSKFLNYQCCM